MTLDAGHGARLACYARDKIREALGGRIAVRPSAAWCDQPRATFCTLSLDDELHGCVGSVEPKRPLADDIGLNAVAAALFDPRARPLSLEDVERLVVEVSILSALSPIAFHDEASAIAALRPHQEGIVFRCGARQSTFLPQVWDDLPDPAAFLRQLKRKAGLPPDFWSPDVMLYRYTLDKWTSAPSPSPAPLTAT